MFSINVDDNIELVLIEENHLDDLYELYKTSKNHIEIYIDDVEKILNNKDKLGRLIKRWLEIFVKKEGFSALIKYRHTFCGFVQFNFSDFEKSGSFGGWVHPDFINKSIASKCANKIIEIAFNEYGGKRLELTTALDNTKAIKTIEKMGFKKEGIKRLGKYINGDFQDVFVYSLISNDWEKKEG